MSIRPMRRRTAQEIDTIVSKILAELDNPTKRLNLEDVRYILRLDKQYYTANDPGLLNGVMHRLRVAGIQVFNRPGLVVDAIKSFSLKALYLPDQKRIFLDSSLPPLKHRWNEAHEIGHSIIPWHEDAMLGDNNTTLSLDCREQIENEANYAAGRLLFLGDHFYIASESLCPNFKSIAALSKEFGNSLTSTFYRFVEQMGDTTPLVGIVSPHPHSTRRAGMVNSQNVCKYFVQSKAFAAQFSRITGDQIFHEAARYCSPASGGILGTSEINLCDNNGELHAFGFETFFNRYDALTIGVYIKPCPTTIYL